MSEEFEIETINDSHWDERFASSTIRKIGEGTYLLVVNPEEIENIESIQLKNTNFKPVY